MPCNRTASRRRRFMRLRTTAPPSTFPTVNPTRSSASSLPPSAAGKTQSCGRRNAGAPVCTRARNPRAGATARCAGNLLRLRDPDRSPLPLARERSQHASTQIANLPRIPEKGETLLTEAGFHRHPLAALGAPPRNYRAAGLGLHPRKKSVRLRAVTTVGLECALGHEKSLLLMNWVSRLKRRRSINECAQPGKPGKTGRCGAGALARRFCSWCCFGLFRPRQPSHDFADECATTRVQVKSGGRGSPAPTHSFLHHSRGSYNFNT